MNSEIWNKIKQESPLAYEKFEDSDHYVTSIDKINAKCTSCFCDITSFFDPLGIIIGIIPTKSFLKNEFIFKFIICISNKKFISGESIDIEFQDRLKAYDEATIKAFKIYNEQLNSL